MVYALIYSSFGPKRRRQPPGAFSLISKLIEPNTATPSHTHPSPKSGPSKASVGLISFAGGSIYLIAKELALNTIVDTVFKAYKFLIIRASGHSGGFIDLKLPSGPLPDPSAPEDLPFGMLQPLTALCLGTWEARVRASRICTHERPPTKACLDVTLRNRHDIMHTVHILPMEGLGFQQPSSVCILEPEL